MTTTLPAILLRTEGAMLLAGTTLMYWDQGGSWLLFALAFFAPDLAMLGYIAGSRTGAVTYNALHTTSLAILVTVIGMVGDGQWLTSIGLVWMAHIGFDRLLGYGLKYSDGFKHNHFAHI